MRHLSGVREGERWRAAVGGMRQEFCVFAAGANECVGGYPICIRLLISWDLSVTRVQHTFDNIKDLAGALETGLQPITSIDRLRSAQDRILWGHD